MEIEEYKFNTKNYKIMEDGSILVDKKRLNELLEDSRKLSCLEAAGVDNWEGYDMACEMFYGENDESIY